MDIAVQIASVLNANPKGLKAAEIALKIGSTRTRVNSYLYSHQDLYVQHEGYIWTIKQAQQRDAPPPTDASRPNATGSSSVNIFQRVGGKLISTVTITPSGNGYSVSSTNNQIACCDCERFFSVHAVACPFCGCPLQFVVDSYFKRFRNNVEATEQDRPPQPVRSTEQPLKHLQQNREDEKKKREILTSIRVKSKYYIGYDLEPASTSLEKLTDIYQNVVERQEVINSIPLSAETFFQQQGVELYMLSTQTLKIVRDRCANYLNKERSTLHIEEQADKLFRDTVLDIIKCDNYALQHLRALYDKYAKEYKGNKEEYELTILDCDGVPHPLEVTFFGKLRSYFRKKSEELFRQAYLIETKLIDPVKGMLFVAYSNLANISIRSSYIKEIAQHINKMLSIEDANKLLSDIDLNLALLYRVAVISQSDTIVEADKSPHAHAKEKVFLLVGIYDDSGYLFTRRVLGTYCNTCNKYYVSESVFLELVTRGRVNARLLTAELSEYDYDDGGIFSNFSPESLLRKCGYTVNAQDSLPDDKRQKILKSVIDNRLYSPEGIISHLTFLVSISKKVETRDMRYAINKWTRDIDYIKSNFHK